MKQDTVLLCRVFALDTPVVPASAEVTVPAMPTVIVPSTLNEVNIIGVTGATGTAGVACARSCLEGQFATGFDSSSGLLCTHPPLSGCAIYANTCQITDGFVGATCTATCSTGVIVTGPGFVTNKGGRYGHSVTFSAPDAVSCYSGCPGSCEAGCG